MSKVRLTSRGSWTAHVFATIRISLFARELSPLAKMSPLGRTHFNGTGRSTDRLICMRRAGRLPLSQALEHLPPRPPVSTTTTTTPVPTPPGCINCCDGSDIIAPGTGAIVSFDYLNSQENRWLDCPSGFTGRFQIFCLMEEVRLVD